MTDEPTLKDLFRVMNEMRGELRGEINDLRDEISELRGGMDGLRGEVKDLRGELRATKRDLGEDIDGINARMTADKASIDEMLAGLRQDLSRHSTITKSTLDSHTARFRTVDGKLDELKDQGRTIVQRLDRAHVPAE
jgi:predicted  nucleic acid-binding Zn-ribbon protein